MTSTVLNTRRRTRASPWGDVTLDTPAALKVNTHKVPSKLRSQVTFAVLDVALRNFHFLRHSFTFCFVAFRMGVRDQGPLGGRKKGEDEVKRCRTRAMLTECSENVDCELTSWQPARGRDREGDNLKGEIIKGADGAQ